MIKLPTDQECPKCRAFFVKEKVNQTTWKFTCTCCKYVEYRYDHNEDQAKIRNLTHREE